MKAVIVGSLAGIGAFAGFYWKQKRISDSQIRTERWVAMIGEIVFHLVESHNNLHPEARVDTRRFANLLFSIGVRQTPAENKN